MPSQSNVSSEPAIAIRHMLPWLVAVAFFMESLDTTILNTGVPIIAQALAVTPLSMKSVLASYTLSLAVFIPVSGWVADRYGTRRVFMCAIGIFTLGSLFCGLTNNIHLLVASRVVQGCGGAMMVPVGRLVLVRNFRKSELVRAMSFVAIPSQIGPLLGPVAGGLVLAYFPWQVIFFINIPVGIAGLVLVYRHLPDYRETSIRPLDVVGLILFGSGIALLSYVLEIFGEHALGAGEVVGLLAISLALIFGYGFHASGRDYPLLQLGLFRIRTFSAAVIGSFWTRLGISGIPFLLPLLYQIGLGLTPVQSGLLIMPQAAASICTKLAMRRLLERLGYRTVLIVNTVMLGIMLMLFAAIGPSTAIWLIVVQAFCYGALTSTQYTSMQALAFADVPRRKASAASSIASTMQQLSVSFGVAAAGLTTVFFIPDRLRSNPGEMIFGLHEAFLVLGAFTVLSTLIFYRLKSADGAEETQERDIHLG